MAAFQRLNKLLKGFLSLFIAELETQNPRALLEAESIALQEAVGQYNQSLAKQASMVERLRMQVRKEQVQVDKLKGRIAALVAAKQDEQAGRLALEAKQRTQTAASYQEQLQQADDMYRNMTRQRDVYVRDARRRVDSIKQKLSQAEIAESQAQLAEIASHTVFDVAGSGATLERLEERLDLRVSEAHGKVRVASDAVAGGEWAYRADQESALESAALADFMSTMGMEKEKEPPLGGSSLAD